MQLCFKREGAWQVGSWHELLRLWGQDEVALTGTSRARCAPRQRASSPSPPAAQRHSGIALYRVGARCACAQSLRRALVRAARWSAPRRAAPRRAHFHRRTACLSRGRARGLQLLPALAHLVVFERIEQVRRLEHVALAGGAACAARHIRPRVRPRAAIAIARGAAWPRRAGAASAANSWALASERSGAPLVDYI